MKLRLYHEKEDRPTSALHGYKGTKGRAGSRHMGQLISIAWDYRGVSVESDAFEDEDRRAIDAAIGRLDPALVLALRSGLVEEITLEVEP